MVVGLKETIDQLTTTNSVRRYGHVLRKALDIKVEGQRKKGRLKKIWKKQVEEESVKVGLSMEDALSRSELIIHGMSRLYL